MTDQHIKSETGIKRLIRKFTDEFSIPENLENYSAEDFEKAQKKFVKYCLQTGCVLSGKDLPYEQNMDR